MTERFSWVDEQEMFTLVMARDCELERFMATLSIDASPLSDISAWPESSDRVKVVTALVDGWTYAMAFDTGVLSDERFEALLRGGVEAVAVWFDLHGNSAFRYGRDGSLVRSCALIGYSFEQAVGVVLPEEADLFSADGGWDERGDGAELVARITGTEPSVSWWTSGQAWSLPLAF